jgi:hypothetical protein
MRKFSKQSIPFLVFGAAFPLSRLRSKSSGSAPFQYHELGRLSMSTTPSEQVLSAVDRFLLGLRDTLELSSSVLGPESAFWALSDESLSTSSCGEPILWVWVLRTQGRSMSALTGS